MEEFCYLSNHNQTRSKLLLFYPIFFSLVAPPVPVPEKPKRNQRKNLLSPISCSVELKSVVFLSGQHGIPQSSLQGQHLLFSGVIQRAGRQRQDCKHLLLSLQHLLGSGHGAAGGRREHGRRDVRGRLFSRSGGGVCETVATPQDTMSVWQRQSCWRAGWGVVPCIFLRRENLCPPHTLFQFFQISVKLRSWPARIPHLTGFNGGELQQLVPTGSPVAWTGSVKCDFTTTAALQWPTMTWKQRRD